MPENIVSFRMLQEWKKAIEYNKPHASIRIGDGEAVVAAHQTILTMDFISKNFGWWINGQNYCGVSLPNSEAREKLVWALQQADFIGLLYQRAWYFRPLADMVMSHYHIAPQKTFYAFDNVKISKQPFFYRYFKDDKVLLVGSKATKFREVLERRYKWTGIVGTVDCSNYDYLDEALLEMDKYDYQLAIVSAGVPGKILTAHAKTTNHVGIDFGSGTDACILADAEGLYAWHWHKYPVSPY